MKVHTHVVFALLCGLLLLPYFGGGIWFLVFVMLGALLPDVDHKQSFINKRLKFTKIFPYFAEHRGIFHSLFAGVVVLGAALWILQKPFAVGLFTGYLSHIFMDSFTKQGVCYLHPLKIFHVKGPFTTGSWGELVLFLVLCVGTILIAFY